MRTWKDVIRVGTYRLPDGRRIEFTRDDLRHLHGRVKAMAAANVLPALSWEHQDEAKPQTAAERRANKARFCLGHVFDARLAGDDELELLLDVPDPDDYRRLASVRFTSPELVDNFIDGNGRAWPGKSITHVAITPTPVQHGQRGFKSAQLSVVRLSLLDRLEDNDVAESNKLESLKRALARRGIILPRDASMTNLTLLIDQIIVAANAMGDARTQEEAEAEAARMSLAGGGKDDPRGCWAPGPRLTPSQVDSLVASHFQTTGSHTDR